VLASHWPSHLHHLLGRLLPNLGRTFWLPSFWFFGSLRPRIVFAVANWPPLHAATNRRVQRISHYKRALVKIHDRHCCVTCGGRRYRALPHHAQPSCPHLPLSINYLSYFFVFCPSSNWMRQRVCKATLRMCLFPPVDSSTHSADHFQTYVSGHFHWHQHHQRVHCSLTP
jgi:hypothetical protein